MANGDGDDDQTLHGAERAAAPRGGLFGVFLEMLEHLRLHSQAAAASALRDRRRTDFRLVIPGGAPGGGAGGSIPLTSPARGRIMSVQNPTGNPLVITLVDDANAGVPVFSASVPAYGYQNVWVPFFSRLYARAGAGAIIAGETLE